MSDADFDDLVERLRVPPPEDPFGELLGAVCAVVDVDPFRAHWLLEVRVPHRALACLFGALVTGRPTGDVVVELAELVATAHREVYG